MAIQPQDRLAGSSHILRYVGALIAGASPQVFNATVPTGYAANTATAVKFAFRDMTALTNNEKRLPALTYDDNQPASLSPHSLAGTFGPGLGGPTWVQNIRVRAHEVEASTASPFIARIDVLSPRVEFGGMGTLAAGNPLLFLDFHFTAAGVAQLDDVESGGIQIAVEIEVPHAMIR